MTRDNVDQILKKEKAKRKRRDYEKARNPTIEKEVDARLAHK
jgi:hypothetical protein